MGTLKKFIATAFFIGIASFILLGSLFVSFIDANAQTYVTVACCSTILMTIIICTGIIANQIERASSNQQDQSNQKPK